MSLSALLEKQGIKTPNKTYPEVTPADRQQRHLDRLPIGCTAIALATGERFVVVDRKKTKSGEIRICSSDRFYLLAEVDVDWKTWLADLTNWKETDYQDVSGMLNTIGEDGDREAFDSLRGTFSREVLKASQPWISDRARVVIKGWLK